MKMKNDMRNAAGLEKMIASIARRVVRLDKDIQWSIEVAIEYFANGEGKDSVGKGNTIYASRLVDALKVNGRSIARANCAIAHFEKYGGMLWDKETNSFKKNKDKEPDMVGYTTDWTKAGVGLREDVPYDEAKAFESTIKFLESKQKEAVKKNDEKAGQYFGKLVQFAKTEHKFAA